MPLYEYKCPGQHCGREFTFIISIAKRDKVDCICGHRAERQPSNPSFTLKGSGFHVNDYPKRKV